jgi:prepilin-type N-terminal cleavage/methylation domain-containing protein
MERLNRAMRDRRKGQRGFTLIELLVVIAVLAILATIVIFNVTGVTKRGQTESCNTDIKSVQSAVDSYINDNPSTFYADFALAADTTPHTLSTAKLVPNYLHTAPTSCKSGFTAKNNAGDATASQGVNVSGS